MNMTNNAVAFEAASPDFHIAFQLSRRLRAVFRLIAIQRHRGALRTALQFADARMQADVGLVNRGHRKHWFEAFLASQAAR
jgi:hypothetical protein